MRYNKVVVFFFFCSLTQKLRHEFSTASTKSVVCLCVFRLLSWMR